MAATPPCPCCGGPFRPSRGHDRCCRCRAGACDACRGAGRRPCPCGGVVGDKNAGGRCRACWLREGRGASCAGGPLPSDPPHVWEYHRRAQFGLPLFSPPVRRSS